MRRDRKFVVRALDGLERRLVLSTAAPEVAAQAVPDPAAQVAPLAAPAPKAPVRQLKAAFIVPLDNSQTADPASAITVSGVGLIRRLEGNAALTGSLQGTGRQGRGEVTLRHTDGSLTLRLRNPRHEGTQRAPVVTMNYRIVGGEGRFAGARGTGKATMQLGVLRDIPDSVGMTMLLEGKLRYA
jgi:hypothetical protein